MYLFRGSLHNFLHTCAIVHLYSSLDLHLATRKTANIALYETRTSVLSKSLKFTHFCYTYIYIIIRSVSFLASYVTYKNPLYYWKVHTSCSRNLIFLFFREGQGGVSGTCYVYKYTVLMKTANYDMLMKNR